MPTPFCEGNGTRTARVRLDDTFPLRFTLAFDGKLLGQVVRIFTDTIAGWYRRRHTDRGLPPGESGALTVIQRANSDLRLNPHFHSVFLDGVSSPDGDGRGQMFHLATAPTQQEVEAFVGRASKRILRFLQRRGVITLVTAPGDGQVTVVGDESMGTASRSAVVPTPAEPAVPTPTEPDKPKNTSRYICWSDRASAAPEDGWRRRLAELIKATSAGSRWGDCASWSRLIFRHANHALKPALPCRAVHAHARAWRHSEVGVL